MSATVTLKNRWLSGGLTLKRGLMGVGAAGGYFLLATLVLSVISGDVAFAGKAAFVSTSLAGGAVVSYVIWPSRWNIPAHLQLAFSVVGYVLPIVVLNGLAGVNRRVLDLYAGILGVGGMCLLVGTLAGAWLVPQLNPPSSLEAMFVRVRRASVSTVPTRVLWLTVLAVAGVSASFMIMGFVPAFADDPFSAKFFRGPYADAYAPIAPLYRLATTAIATLLPIVALYALWRKKLVWVPLLVVTVGVLLLTLQRDPAASGVLVALGVAVALARRRWLTAAYVAVLVCTYFLGSAMYFVLAMLGVRTYAGAGIGEMDFLRSVAAGAPDVADHIAFLSAWLRDPEFALGRTFFGGLIPGGYEWNPAVWSLTITNPGSAISEITSGGFRLPAPVWGFVNLSWPGVVVVGILTGLLTGATAAIAREYFERVDRQTRHPSTRQMQGIALVLLLFITMFDMISQLSALSYVTFLQAALMLAVLLSPRLGGNRLFPRRPRPDSSKMLDEQTPLEGPNHD